MWQILYLALIYVLLDTVSSLNVTVRTGSSLLLNCSITNGSWWFHGKEISSAFIRLQDGRSLLKLYNVTENSQGVYTCSLPGQQGYNVGVTVVAPPSPPRNLGTSIIDNRTILKWSPSLSVGLSLQYRVCKQCLHVTHEQQKCVFNGNIMMCKYSNCTYDGYDAQIVQGCNNIFHVPGKLMYECEVHLTPFRMFSVYVEARNSAGVAKSEQLVLTGPVFPEQMNPGPPKDLHAVSQGGGEVLLKWIPRDLWQSYTMKYQITFYAEGIIQSLNQTWPGLAGTTSARIRDLQSGNTYHFTVRAKICASEDCSIWGQPASVSYEPGVFTAPSRPPSQLNCSQWVSYGANSRNVTVTWQAPARKYQNGDLTQYLLTWSYRGDSSNMSQTLLVNASQLFAELTHLKQDRAVEIRVKACNDFDCGGISSCETPASLNLIKEPGESKDLIIAVGTLVPISIIVAIGVGVYYYSTKRRREKIERRPSLPPIDEPPYHTLYNDLLPRSDDENEYDEARVASL
ncbi:uncharacterized protein LOC5504145 isoform X2 [Nematostella vectensis]|uniref:uncharacterized protein LOC5504145 isoform X2 n=1 Tax=Nematostella vectensis TaxID=45351 RepID=UPI002077653E|nr:uncharacterized protein LOC5504145 isoform X2 [Nematostella vectensis]